MLRKRDANFASLYLRVKSLKYCNKQRDSSMNDLVPHGNYLNVFDSSSFVERSKRKQNELPSFNGET